MSWSAAVREVVSYAQPVYIEPDFVRAVAARSEHPEPTDEAH